MRVDDFKSGERVRHMSGCVGTVVEVGPYRGARCVVVEFPPSSTSRKKDDWRGAYDDGWLRIYPDGLTKIETT